MHTQTPINTLKITQTLIHTQKCTQTHTNTYIFICSISTQKTYTHKTLTYTESFRFSIYIHIYVDMYVYIYILAHIWTQSGMRGVPAMSKTLIKSPQVKSPHECAFPYPRRKDGAWAHQAPSKSPKGSQSCQGRVRNCRCARQISAETASTSRSRCCFTQNSPMKVRFLPKEAGTNRRGP